MSDDPYARATARAASLQPAALRHVCPPPRSGSTARGAERELTRERQQEILSGEEFATTHLERDITRETPESAMNHLQRRATRSVGRAAGTVHHPTRVCGWGSGVGEPFTSGAASSHAGSPHCECASRERRVLLHAAVRLSKFIH